MSIESRFGANEGGQQPSEMLYLANRENALLAHTLDRQILEEIEHKTSENFDISNRFWSKNRSYRKQMTKPCLTGARIALRESQLCRSASQISHRQDPLERHKSSGLCPPQIAINIASSARNRQKLVWYTWNLGQQ
jgi:hypothetical protein